MIDLSLTYTIGILDRENALGQRIGDKITLSGISIKCMLELNEGYSDVTFRMLVIRCAKGDIPTADTLWQGASGNKMIDTINTERYSVLAQKYVKLTAPNQVNTPTGTQRVGSGFQTGTNTISRATRIIKFYIPGSKISRNGIVQYENNSSQVKFFDIYLLCYAYSNYSTSAT